MENTEKEYHEKGPREADPGNFKENDLRTPPDKNVSETDPLRATESDHGRYVSQKPDTENLDQIDFQIDEGTKQLHYKNSGKESDE